MKRFNFKFLPALSVKGWCDGNLVTFDHNCPDTMQTLDYLDSDLSMERLIGTIMLNYQIKANMKTAKKIIKEDDGLSRDIYDNWNIT